MRKFQTGATRDDDNGKLDFEACLSPSVLRRYAEYMQKQRVQRDGSVRPDDNWQKGIPRDAYMKSAWRHFHSWWESHRNGDIDEDEICAVLFNVFGYLHEELKSKNPNAN